MRHLSDLCVDGPDGSFTLTKTNGPDQVIVTEYGWRVVDYDGTLECHYHDTPIGMDEAVRLMRELAKKYQCEPKETEQ